jgi:16S rRNA G1207 methylase RsmC
MVSTFGALLVAGRFSNDLEKNKRFIVTDIGCGGGNVGSILRGVSREENLFIL